MILEGIAGSQPATTATDSPVCEHLTLRLLVKGQQSGVFTSSDVLKIQSDILVLLQEKIKHYNHSESSSVTVDTAEHLLRSILYTLDICLMAYHDESQPFSLLKFSPLDALYQRGLKVLEGQVNESRFLYHKVTKNRLNKGTFAYNSTIEQAIPEFFRSYDLAFGAHDTIASIDYPVYKDDCTVSGIRYIKQYLQKLELENRFCLGFSSLSILRLLQHYGHIHGVDYRDTLANISEIILGNGIFAILTGDCPGSLNISALQLGILKEILHPLQENAMQEMMYRAQLKLLHHLGLADSRYIGYYADFPSNLTPRIIQARENSSLNNIIVVNSMPSNKATQQFFQGPKLDSISFRMLVEQLLQCSDCSAKTDLIRRRVKSLDDFLDILEADCLDCEDYLSLYQTLGDLELSSLLTAVVPGEICYGNLEQICVSLDSQENQPEWRAILEQFLAQIPAKRLKAVEDFISSS